MPKSEYRKLELTWYNKDKVLIWNEDKNNYEWIEPNDIHFAEPRILKEKAVYGEPNSEYNPETKRWEKSKKKIPKEEQNLLIKGDNLLALKSLEDQYTGKIKLIYIDPPFNTGSAYEHYDDGLEHSIWLSMMKSRLEILYKLLRKDGIIFVHIDNTEFAYLKIILDEIFRRQNFINHISWERSAVAGLGLGGNIINVTEYILCYAKNKTNFSINKEYRVKKNFSIEKLKGYSLVLQNTGKKKLFDEFTAKSTGLPVKIFKHIDFHIERISFQNIYERYSEIMKQYQNKFDRIFRTFLVQKENQFQHEIINRIREGLYSIEYTPSRGKHEGKNITIYYLNRELVGWLKDGAILTTEGIIKNERVSDFWTKEDISNAARGEGGIRGFDRSIKPEELLRRIIEMTTSPNDWVLDSFAGSGTTGAVAHKLGRKWIMIEIGNHADTHIIPRMKRIIPGEDQTGITKEVGFKGGGGFRYYVLGKSAFKKDEIGIIEMTYDNGDLIEAICKIEEFKFVGREFFDKTKLHGVINGKRYCHIAENFVTQDYIDNLSKEISEDQSLVIYAMKKMSKMNLPHNIEVKKIPRDIIRKFKLSNSENKNGNGK